jgi:hypothetical protein
LPARKFAGYRSMLTEENIALDDDEHGKAGEVVQLENVRGENAESK